MLNLNKSHVAETMAELADIPKYRAEEYLDYALEAIIQTLAKAKNEEPNKNGVRGKLTVVGFGTFEVKEVPERLHRNPQEPDKTVVKPAHNTVKVKIGSLFKDAVNE